MGRTRPPSEVGNRRIVETPGTADDSDWSYPLPTELSQPLTLPPGVVECRVPAEVDTSGTRMGLCPQGLDLSVSSCFGDSRQNPGLCFPRRGRMPYCHGPVDPWRTNARRV
ncbi:hypothetical protein BGW80DRAFT_830614 [Lactifluus volemus]|nr:hypothetical protein BGW80DRAFT_830614 [Lactifluus volemus]